MIFAARKDFLAANRLFQSICSLEPAPVMMAAVPVMAMPVMTPVPIRPAPSIGRTVVAIDRAVVVRPPVVPAVAVMRTVPVMAPVPVMPAVPVVPTPMRLLHEFRSGGSRDGCDG